MGRARLPLATVLYEGDAVATLCATDPNLNGVAMAGNEDVVFIMDGDTIFGENRNRAIVSSFADAHE